MMFTKYIKVSTLLLSFVTLFNCSGFLDKDPENVFPPESIDFTNSANMFDPVSGVYATAASGNGFSSWASLGLIAVRGDDLEKGSAPNDQVEFRFADEFKYNLLRSYWALNGTWNNLYNIVIRANYALEDLDQFAKHLQTEDQRKLYTQYTAEVRFLRSYAFFYIARLWGNAPLLLDNSIIDPNNTNRPVAAPRDSIYKFINREMDYCISILPAVRPNQMPHIGQVTKYTALTLKAKANADINDWDAVLSSTNEVISSNLFSLFDQNGGFYELFKIPGKTSNESLYELQYTDFGSGSGDAIRPDNWFSFQGPRSPLKAGGGREMNNGWGFLPPTQKLLDLFISRGEKIRYTTTFLFTNSITPEGDTLKKAEVGEPTMYSGKAYLPSTQLTPGRLDYGSGNNIRMLRYADVLLLNAEAKVRKGLNGDTPFNLVRKRAEMPELTNVTLDQILEERFVEFACEWGERFYDLVRTGKAAEVLPGFKSGEHEFYPIPQNQIDLNPNLK